MRRCGRRPAAPRWARTWCAQTTRAAARVESASGHKEGDEGGLAMRFAHRSRRFRDRPGREWCRREMSMAVQSGPVVVAMLAAMAGAEVRQAGQVDVVRAANALSSMPRANRKPVGGARSCSREARWRAAAGCGMWQAWLRSHARNPQRMNRLIQAPGVLILLRRTAWSSHRRVSGLLIQQQVKDSGARRRSGRPRVRALASIAEGCREPGMRMRHASLSQPGLILIIDA